MDAEDAVAKAFGVLYINILNGKYEPRASLKNYYFGIIKKMRPPKPLIPNSPEYDLSASAEPVPLTPEDEAIKREVEDVLRKLLEAEGLGERCKKVLRLYGLSYLHAEIAEEMETTEKYSKQMVFRCFKKVRKILKKHPNLKQQLLDLL
jgi:DNA-directed RNA polymerase specialized sigma24 family protein